MTAEGVAAKAAQVVQARDQAGQVTVAVGERTRVDLVDHRAFPPGRLEGLQHGASTGEPALLLGTLG
ncbi:hypothetical protein AN471_29495 [Pseudomonas aeruginosa]|nr:hypothetical protein TO65_23745 [Pseudomonas aeruginosa]KWZ71550.1 hypothetical protein AKG06_15460 [Pseudomonas aeruginosa]OFB78917.1 hypothetical protein AN471_29495 [Pseudomonas aeruginosa]RAP67400.1 hypothetical protein AXW85_25665 [Pseudomonas aeruginosa]